MENGGSLGITTLTIEDLPTQDKLFPIKDDTLASHEILCMERKIVVSNHHPDKLA